MAYPNIVFNNSTGSNTQASGAGPTTALHGTGASTTASANTVNLSVDSPDLSGVATDGSACLWVQSSSGRQFNKITAVDNGTKVVTCQDNFANTESSRTWAIGGKRSTLDNADSRNLGTDFHDNWTMEIQYTGTDYTLSTTAFTLASSDSAARYFTIAGTGNSRPIVRQTSDVACIKGHFGGTGGDSSYLSISFLTIQNSNGSKTAADGIYADLNTSLAISNCIIGDATNQLHIGINATYSLYITVVDTEIKNCTGNGIDVSGSTAFKINSCYIHNNLYGLVSNTGGSNPFIIYNNIITNNTNIGLYLHQVNYATYPSIIIFNTIDNNGSDGISFNNYASYIVFILNNQVTNNGGYGVNFISGDSLSLFGLFKYNNFYNNTSGACNNITPDSTNLTVNPQYTNAGSNDYSIGTNTKAKGFPDSTLNIGANQSSTKSYVDIGAAQRQEPTAGGPVGTNLRGGFAN